MTRAPRPRQRGFTLIELLIAAALLAVLAVLSWRGLDAVLVSRDRIGTASGELQALTIAFAQLDEDLRRSWPVVRQLGTRGPPPIGFSIAGERAAAALELLRETSGTDEPWRLQRVAYRLNGGVLERGFGTWLPMVPQGDSPRGFQDDMVWQPILAQVASLEWRAWRDNQGWIPASALAGRGPPPAAAGAAPLTGVELVVTRADGARVLRIFAVSD
ncbi:MAG TPA: prepilin-type N-terminal cleavage/methylation domain-containing protein [Burkholderiaceae bacterium]|nr:prepilin-type N-terminal cleavage/methylation domain-containing protein [Burkholderiaceae bacterium]